MGLGRKLAAKFLVAGCLRDPTLVAWLLAVYFDASLSKADNEGDANSAEVKEVGNPVWLQ